jgi:hypothetical protein
VTRAAASGSDRRALRGALFALAFLAAPLACDPVRDAQIAALGPEAPGVPRGPLHRPGQPCLYCHDGSFGHPPRFTVAGTVFQTTSAESAAVGAQVALVDANGGTATLQTNEAGNFYVGPSEYDPTFPVQVSVRGPGGETARMYTLILGNGAVEPNGACASCHFGPPGPGSPGHVALRLDDGGIPP